MISHKKIIFSTFFIIFFLRFNNSLGIEIHVKKSIPFEVQLLVEDISSSSFNEQEIDYLIRKLDFNLTFFNRDSDRIFFLKSEFYKMFFELAPNFDANKQFKLNSKELESRLDQYRSQYSRFSRWALNMILNDLEIMNKETDQKLSKTEINKRQQIIRPWVAYYFSHSPTAINNFFHELSLNMLTKLEGLSSVYAKNKALEPTKRFSIKDRLLFFEISKNNTTDQQDKLNESDVSDSPSAAARTTGLSVERKQHLDHYERPKLSDSPLELKAYGQEQKKSELEARRKTLPRPLNDWEYPADLENFKTGPN